MAVAQLVLQIVLVVTPFAPIATAAAAAATALALHDRAQLLGDQGDGAGQHRLKTWSDGRADMHRRFVLRRASRRGGLSLEAEQQLQLIRRDAKDVPPPGSPQLQFPSAANEDALAATGAEGGHGIPAANSTFDYDRALLLTKLAAVTQCQPNNIAHWNCTRCGRVPDIRHTAMVHDKEQELLAFTGWLASESSIVVVFRGTDKRSLLNWVADLKAWKTDYDLPWKGAEGCRVHSGFFSAYNTSSLRPFVIHQVRELLEQYGQNTPITVVGHSLGGALATLCAVELAVGEVEGVSADINLFTLGSPRVGNAAFAAYAAHAVYSTLRMTHGSDVVPSVPTTAMGFQHLPQEVWLLDVVLDTKKYFGSPVQILVLCDGSGEDPSCHNSECYLGVCTSTFDHTHGYFGLYLGQEQAC